MKNISVIIPCRNEEKYIKNCLYSVINNDYDKKLIEVFVIDGKSEDKTVEIVKEISKKYPYIKILENPQKTVPYALNLGIRNASGDIIIRLDAHASFPSDYFSKIVKWHNSLKDADNIGGVCLTDVKNNSKKSVSIKKVLSNKFGVGNSLFRTGVKKITETDTVPFGSFKKNVFKKYGLFNENLTRNQDIEFNKRIKNNGGKIVLVPEIHCTYYARENYKDLAKNNYQNGLWNILTIYYTKDWTSLSLRHFIPLFFVLSLIIPLPFMFIWLPIGLISVISFFSYLLSVLIISIIINDKQTSFWHLIRTFFILHFSYGIGSLIGIFKFIKLYLKNEKN